MASQSGAFARGEWIVHTRYGIGRVVKEEKKRIGGRVRPFYRVKSSNSTFWIPKGQEKSTRVRPLCSKRELRKALAVLGDAPQEMASSAKERHARIKSTRADGSLPLICALVRDLMARKRENGLGYEEGEALGFFKSLLLREWAICQGVQIGEVERKLRQILRQGTQEEE
jgi:RNA polymerase-interacting CarD/CdnL/TRCF family regulator